MRWSYGVTTVPERMGSLLPRTLRSLSIGGFESPRLFIDGTGSEYKYEGFGLTVREPKIRTFGNWVLAAWELYLREPLADRFAVFQDDLVCYRNLRQYLEQCEYPDQAYLNLYTFPHNVRKSNKGWYLSDQRGKGAVALVFSNEALRTLLRQQHIVDRPLDVNRGWRAVDGGIVDAMRKAGWKEFVHMPSLVQHTGVTSSMGNAKFPLADSFRGEDFDALSLVCPEVSNFEQYMEWTMKKITLEDERDYVLWRESSGRTCEIFNIQVGTERGKGRGTRLVEMVKSEARSGGYRLVFAVTRVSNEISQEFYRGIGFRTVGLLRGFYLDEEPPGDAVVYGFDL